jgi:hypothetical protein
MAVARVPWRPPEEKAWDEEDRLFVVFPHFQPTSPKAWTDDILGSVWDMGREPSEPLFREILARVSCTRFYGSSRQRIGADTWGPAVEKHRPAGDFVGDACVQCGEPWPCRFLRGLLRSGLVVPPPKDT